MTENKLQQKESDNSTTIQIYKAEARELNILKHTYNFNNIADVVRWVLKVFKDVIPIKK